MACKTCDHTMQRLTAAYWCPRCGTIKMKVADHYWEVPMLPGRVKKLVDNALVHGTTLIDYLHTSGITESVTNASQEGEGEHIDDVGKMQL